MILTFGAYHNKKIYYFAYFYWVRNLGRAWLDYYNQGLLVKVSHEVAVRK